VLRHGICSAGVARATGSSGTPQNRHSVAFAWTTSAHLGHSRVAISFLLEAHAEIQHPVVGEIREQDTGADEDDASQRLDRGKDAFNVARDFRAVESPDD
jgi:hypothetical protein